MRLIIAALLVVSLGAAPARAAEPVASIPYRVAYGGWFTVAAQVNGEGPFDFIIDTGATHTLVFENLAARQGYELSGGPPSRVFGLSADREYLPYYVGEIMLADNLRFSERDAVILGDWEVDRASPQGVLGLDILADYTMLFDHRTQVLHFYEPDGAPDAPRGWDTVDLATDNFSLEAGDLYTLSARIDGRPMRFLLDLGASGTIINGPAFRNVVRRPPVITLRGTPTRLREEVTDALDVTARAVSFHARVVRAGGARWRDPRLIAYDAPIFAEMGAAETPFGLFGSDMLAARSFLLDFPGKRLVIGPPPRDER